VPEAIVSAMTDEGDARLPGEELVTKDLARGVESVEALLVSIGAPRLTRAGYVVESPSPSAELRLYKLLSERDPDGAHSADTALLRRLVSFERAAECVS